MVTGRHEILPKPSAKINNVDYLQQNHYDFLRELVLLAIQHLEIGQRQTKNLKQIDKQTTKAAI